MRARKKYLIPSRSFLTAQVIGAVCHAGAVQSAVRRCLSFSIRGPEFRRGAVIWTSSFNTAEKTRRIAVCTRLIRLF